MEITHNLPDNGILLRMRKQVSNLITDGSLQLFLENYSTTFHSFLHRVILFLVVELEVEEVEGGVEGVVVEEEAAEVVGVDVDYLLLHSCQMQLLCHSYRLVRQLLWQ